MEDKHANKKRRQITPVVCVHMFVCTQERLFLLFLLVCLFPTLSVLPFFPYMAPIYLPISLFFSSSFSPPFPSPPSLLLHHTTSTALFPTCLSVARSKEGTEEHREITHSHTQTNTKTHTQIHICVTRKLMNTLVVGCSPWFGFWHSIRHTNLLNYDFVC